MAEQKCKALARPSNPEAQAIANNHDDSGFIAQGAITMFYIMAVGLALTHGVPRWLLGILVVFGSVLVGSYFVTPFLGKSAKFHRYVRAGEILLLDEFFLETWNGLLKEAGIELSNEEHDQEIGNLFDAAHDLKDDLTERHRLEQDSDQAVNERKLYLEARIRARLLHEIQALKDRREILRDVMADLPPVSPALESGVTHSEVLQQLHILHERKSDHQQK